MSEPRTGADIFGLVRMIDLEIEKRIGRFLVRRGLTEPQFKLLVAVASQGSRTLGDLAKALGCTRGNLTGVVDRLERDGWLNRVRHRDDRRIVTLELTEKGQRIGEIQEAVNAHLAKLMGHWAPDDRRTLAGLLGHLCQEQSSVLATAV